MQIQALNSIKRLFKTLIKAKCYELLGTEDQYGVGESFCLKRNKNSTAIRPNQWTSAVLGQVSVKSTLAGVRYLV